MNIVFNFLIIVSMNLFPSPDCSTNNATCLNMTCDGQMINAQYKHGICKCKFGYYLDENQNCLGMAKKGSHLND